MKKSTFILFAALFILGQSNKASAQYFTNIHENEEIFKYEVKLVEEFIERFNDDKNSFIRQEYAKEKKPFTITRAQLIVSLFNLDDQSFANDTSLKGFFREVLEKGHPKYLDFVDSNWYAEVKCIFSFNHQQMEIPIVLHIKKLPDNAVEWLIAGIGDMKQSDAGATHFPNKDLKDRSPKFIPSSDYATNFSDFHHIFTPGFKPNLFMDPEAINSKNGKTFIKMIQNKDLEFEYTKEIVYHFFQIDGWVFTVKNYERRTTNSGWLIGNIQKADKDEKNTILKSLLHI